MAEINIEALRASGLCPKCGNKLPCACDKTENLQENWSDKIESEDKKLENSPKQRKIELLDYIRRGRLMDNIEIMPELLDAFPKFLQEVESGKIDIINFNSDAYNFQEVKNFLLDTFKKFEEQLIQTDKKYKEILEKFGIKVKNDIYIDKKRFEAIKRILEMYRESLSPENMAKVKANNPEEVKRKALLQNLKRINLLDDANISLLPNYKENQGIYDQLIDEQSDDFIDLDNPLTKYIYDSVTEVSDKKGKYNPEKNGFKKYSKMSEYEGDIVNPKEIDLSDVNLRRGVEVIKRGELPDVVKGYHDAKKQDFGVTIIDGNLGRDEEGIINEQEGIMVIDHHDKLEEEYAGKRYDTATVMMTRILSEHLEKSGWTKGKQDKESWKKGMESFLHTFGSKVQEVGAEEPPEKEGKEINKLRISINHLDSDSVLSSWAYMRPHKAMKYKEIIDKTSICGDFLVGSNIMEYGANARDYEYIFRYYLDTCKDKIKEEKNSEYKEELEKINKEIQGIFDNRVIEDGREQDEFKAMMIKAESFDPKIIELKQKLQSASGEQKKSISMELQAAKSSSKELQDFIQKGKVLDGLIKIKSEVKTKIKKNEKRRQLTPEENTVILNHMHSVVEDIITNPFKYQEFIKQGRKEENETIAQIDGLYKNGEIDIHSDSEDEGIIIIEPGKDKDEIPSYNSVDGLYFYLRKREDFNKPIVVTHRGRNVMFAINTQNARDLQKYNFNDLVDVVKQRESEILAEMRKKIEDNLIEIKNKFNTESDKNKKKILDREIKSSEKNIKELAEDEQKNKSGEIWRNRTQMIFSGKTAIPFEELMGMVRDWKTKHEVEK